MFNYLGNNIKFLRAKHNMTQEELAKKIGKDYSTIGKWELNQRTPVMLDTIEISKIFNVSLEQLLMSDLRIKNNEYDDQIKKIAIKSGVKIEIGKNKELTADDVLEINKILINEINNNGNDK